MKQTAIPAKKMYVQSQQQEHQNRLQNMFEVSRKDTRTTSKQMPLL